MSARAFVVAGRWAGDPGSAQTCAMDIDSCLERSSRCELLEESEISALCFRYKEMLLDAPNMPDLSSPITVVGDIHGQFQDLVELFRVGGTLFQQFYWFVLPSARSYRQDYCAPFLTREHAAFTSQPPCARPVPADELLVPRRLR